MALTPGGRLGVYEVIASIGVGGMGEVFRARDTTLNRDVALKILPDAFAKDPDRLLRFTREAQTLASLNHPHIAAIYGLDDGNEASIWIYELSGRSSMRRLTFEGQGHNRCPVWSADSQRVAFQSDREGDLGIFWQRVDGTGTAERLTKADEGAAHISESWAPDGEHLLYNAGKGGATTLWVLSLKDRKAARFDAVESPAATLTGAVISSDGRWVAYASREGRTSSAVYVQPFPPTGGSIRSPRTLTMGIIPCGRRMAPSSCSRRARVFD